MYKIPKKLFLGYTKTIIPFFFNDLEKQLIALYEVLVNSREPAHNILLNCLSKDKFSMSPMKPFRPLELYTEIAACEVSIPITDEPLALQYKE